MTTLPVACGAVDDPPIVVYGVTAVVAERRVAWAAVTIQAVGQAFANVFLEEAMPAPDRRLFLDAVTEFTMTLGARQVRLVLAKRDRSLMAHVHARCAVMSIALVGQTYLVHADMQPHDVPGGAASVPWRCPGTWPRSSPECDIRVEILWASAGPHHDLDELDELEPEPSFG